MESGKGIADKIGTKDLVLQISSPEEAFVTNKERKDSKAFSPFTDGSSYSFSMNSQLGSSPKNLELTHASPFRRSPSSSNEIWRDAPAASKPPKIPRTSLARSSFSKPKSRLIEPAYPNDAKLMEEKTAQKGSSSSPYRSPPNNKVSTPKENLRSTPITPKTPLIGSPGEEEEDDEVYKTADVKVSEKSGKKWKISVMIEWIAFVCILGCFISSTTVHKLQHHLLWGLQLWKWCVLVMVIFCGRLLAEWMMNVVVFLIERNFLLKKKVLYFVFGLKKSVRFFVWLGLVLLAWGLLFNHGVKRSKKTTRVLNHITRALASCRISAAIWLVKTLLVKMLASSFQCTRFFDRIQESIFHQYILRVLSGRPLMEMTENAGRSAASSGRMSFRNLEKQKDGKKEEVIDVEKLKKMTQEKVSAWTMKGLMNVISGSGLSTISNELEDVVDFNLLNLILLSIIN